MDYLEVKAQLEALQMTLMTKMQNPDLTLDEKEAILRSIANYEYIIELTCMNHFERGKVIN